MIKEWLLKQILQNKMVFFKDEDGNFDLINEIDFSGDIVICYFKDRSCNND